MPADVTRGLLDTNILILAAWIDPLTLPEVSAVSAVTLGELSAGVSLVRGDDADARAERGRRLEVLQRVESEFDPIPFGAAAARIFGRICGAVADHGRTPRSRVADLMVAATAAAEGLALYTSNPDDFVGLGGIVEVIAVPRPSVGG